LVNRGVLNCDTKDEKRRRTPYPTAFKMLA
jgi:hypothetical protein